MRDPNRLKVLQRANELTQLTYAATRHFPPSEQGALADQLRRAVTSVSGNIAEGADARPIVRSCRICRMPPRR